jgi:TctA family transporter
MVYRLRTMFYVLWCVGSELLVGIDLSCMGLLLATVGLSMWYGDYRSMLLCFWASSLDMYNHTVIRL